MYVILFSLMCFYLVDTVLMTDTEQWKCNVIHQIYTAVPSDCVVIVQIRYTYIAVVSKCGSNPLHYIPSGSANAHQHCICCFVFIFILFKTEIILFSDYTFIFINAVFLFFFLEVTTDTCKYICICWKR